MKVPKNVTMSTYDDFPFKMEIFEILNKLKEQGNKLVQPMQALWFYVLSYFYCKSFFIEEYDVGFLDQYFESLPQIYDNIAAWSEDEIKYLNEVSFYTESTVDTNALTELLRSFQMETKGTDLECLEKAKLKDFKKIINMVQTRAF